MTGPLLQRSMHPTPLTFTADLAERALLSLSRRRIYRTSFLVLTLVPHDPAGERRLSVQIYIFTMISLGKQRRQARGEQGQKSRPAVQHGSHCLAGMAFESSMLSRANRAGRQSYAFGPPTECRTAPLNPVAADFTLQPIS